MKKNLRIFSVMFFLALHWVAFGQGKTITGKVTDDLNAPLPGVSVVIEGTSQGTITTIDGDYSLSVPENAKTLVFSFIGFQTQKVQVSGKSTINVQLLPDVKSIDEVVVVGYGSMKKTDLSGSSVTVSQEKLKGSVITNLDQALQGRAAGVSTVSTSGAPGASVSVRVRGQATINSNAEPLYVIDGVIIQSSGSSNHSYGLGALGNGNSSAISPLSTINPSDILSMEVLKDASATAIYGAQGANGVVLITTKRGKQGEAKFSYEGLYGVQSQNVRLEMMNLREFASFSNSVAAESNSLDTREEFNDPSLLGVGTNWQDAVFQRAAMQQHQISAQGGSDKVTYYVSGSYMDQEGTIIGTSFNRYSFRTNIDAQLKKWAKLGVNFNYSNTNERLGLAEGTEGIINYSLLTPPDIPIYDIDGNYASVVREGYTRVNPIAKAMDEDYLLDRSKLNGNVFLDITPIKNLVWHSELGFDINGSRAEVFLPQVTYGNWHRDINENSIQRNNNQFMQIKNYLTYSGNYDQHSYTLMVGQEAWESKYEFQSIKGKGLPDNSVHNPALGTSDYNITSGFGSSAMSSFFGRATYNYGGRYYGTYTYRRDGSSNFGPKNRWADFNSFALSWRFSEEEFFTNFKHILSNGKIRFGWGQTGNSNIGGYLWGSSISKMPTGLGMGYRQSNIANPYIQWETQEQLNLGIDLGFLKDRINLVVDLYDKTSEDMLMQLQLPSYMGTGGNQSSALAAPMGNYGTINNKGIEIALNTKNIQGQFEWDTEFIISANKNKLEALDGTASTQIEGYGQWSDIVSLTNVGQSLYNFYGYKVLGVYKDRADIENSPKALSYPKDGVFNKYNTVWVGDIKFADLSGPDGKPDGKIDSYDRTNIGNPIPKFTYGFTNNFRYKNFDLSIFINGTYGNKIMNYSSINLSGMTSIWDNQLKVVNDRAILATIDPALGTDNIDNVVVSNPNTKTPRAIANDPNDNNRISDRYVEDGSYLRIKNLTLGYNVPSSFLKRYYMDNLRLYVNIQNLYTFTKYSGYDPEVGVSTLSNNVYGLDNGRYPAPQVYSFGLNISF